MRTTCNLNYVNGKKKVKHATKNTCWCPRSCIWLLMPTHVLNLTSNVTLQMKKQTTRKCMRSARLHYEKDKKDKKEMKLYCSQEANHVQTSKSLHYTPRHLPLHLIYKAAFQSLSISHTIEWRHYNLAAGVLSLWRGKYDLLRWKKDLYRNKKRCVETNQIRSTRLSDGVPLAVTNVIALRFISVERGQNQKVETKERRRGGTIVFRELIIIRQRSCMWAY